VREDSDTGAYEIRQLDEDVGSLPFQVSAAWRTKMFDLAAQLKHFQGTRSGCAPQNRESRREKRFAGNPAPKSMKQNSTTL